jgi:hypothetical protein
MKNNFENKKRKAQSRISNIFRTILHNFKNRVKESDKTSSFLKFILAISIILLISLPLGLYNFLKTKFNFTGDYNLAHFLSNLAIVISLIVAIQKKK